MNPETQNNKEIDVCYKVEMTSFMQDSSRASAAVTSRATVALYELQCHHSFSKWVRNQVAVFLGLSITNSILKKGISPCRWYGTAQCLYKKVVCLLMLCMFNVIMTVG